MPTPDHLAWPFFDTAHRSLAEAAMHWATRLSDPPLPSQNDLDILCRQHVHQLAEAGWLQYGVVPLKPASNTSSDSNAPQSRIDIRAFCLLREILAYHSTLADFSFVMQGLGSGPLSLFGSLEQKARYLPAVVHGEKIAAFALSEAQAGSDVSAITCQARPLMNGQWQIDGEKTWVSNGGLADFYVVFARTGPEGQAASSSLSAFIVDADTPGLHIAERLTTVSPHPLARLRFDACRIPVTQQIGQTGEGFKIAMATLDLFRPSVGAAALGMARRAHDEARRYTENRSLFGSKLADLQMSQARFADMETALDASALLVYRAAWACDQGGRATRESAMAKLFSTEQAQSIVDTALQFFGGKGLLQGEKIEALYRDIRALRIYEGASEIQKLVINRESRRKFLDR